MINLKVGQLFEINSNTIYSPIFVKFQDKYPMKHVRHNKGNILLYCGKQEFKEIDWEYFFCVIHGLVLAPNVRIEMSLNTLDLIYYD